jgi:hypothetical protein
MTTVGLLLPILGGAVAVAPLHYEMHLDAAERWLGGQRERLGSWQ